MNPYTLIEKYFPDSNARTIILEHSRLVAHKALRIAQCLAAEIDLEFVEQAALLHDIGVCRISAPDIGCHGADNYLCHGIHGRAILEAEGFPRHALVCERHIGVGLTADEILTRNLPLPARAMGPTCIEEEIISYADLFYSKTPGKLTTEKSVEQVRSGLARFGAEKLVIFDQWLERFGNPCLPCG
ncbi:HD domain-containing protein [Geobacter pelophilus]|uniref:HD domain-containing protein n=2 Tax=Geoanaerobacter pelophilus TaxID=60036 RepID=A0AAW4L4B2_9BACT|nr:HD domain-containing protein [Geoanaerobacter pelophilus]MBT0665836.1 HD domain-containing protein [Geoanaerobacter pelophilus]